MLQYELEMYHDVEVMADLPVNTIDITGNYWYFSNAAVIEIL